MQGVQRTPQEKFVAAGITQGDAFLPLMLRVLTGMPGLRGIIATMIGWGMRPARMKLHG